MVSYVDGFDQTPTYLLQYSICTKGPLCARFHFRFHSSFLLIVYFFVHILLAKMSPRKPTGKVLAKTKKSISIELKHEIINKHNQGFRVSELVKEYGRSSSTICTILKQKETIKKISASKGLAIISKRRNNIHDEMEKLLLLWVKEKQLLGDTVTEAIICEKSISIFEDLKRAAMAAGWGGASSGLDHDDFKASHGWFFRFKKRSGIHSVVRHGEAASADLNAGKEFVSRFSEIIAEEGYTPQQVFNCDETGLFWKRMPQRTFITVEENKMPGHKTMKDRLTLALCGNASGDLKIKPILVYHAENPRAFKRHNVKKKGCR